MSFILSVEGIGLILGGMGFGIGVPGLVYSIKSYLSADRADKISRRNYEMLHDSNLVYQSIKGSFDAIYREFLLEPLALISQSKPHPDAKIQLMLSTPAYGFGAVDELEVARYLDLIADCSKKCQLDMILHSPEFHWTYWANVLLWSASRDLIEGKESLSSPESLFDQGKVTDAVKFALAICRFHRSVHDAPATFRLWLGNNVNVRMYAYDYGNDELAVNLYVANTDAISLMSPQFGREGFQAVGSKIAAHSVNLYINAETSQFERQKICHYLNDFDPHTGREKGQVETLEVSALLGDYVFGRTAFSVLLPLPDRSTAYLESLIQVIWLKTRKLMQTRGQNGDLLTRGLMTKLIALHVLQYFARISRTNDHDNALFGLRPDEGQGTALKGRLDSFCPSSSPLAFDEHFGHALSMLSEIDPAELEPDGQRLEEALLLIQGLLTSGVRCSDYGEGRIRRAPAVLAGPHD